VDSLQRRLPMKMQIGDVTQQHYHHVVIDGFNLSASSGGSSGSSGSGSEEFSYKCAGWFDSDARCRRSCSFKAGPGELARDPWATIEANSKRKLVCVFPPPSFIVGNLLFFKLFVLICFKNNIQAVK
jgi:hypothetical protein